MYQRILLKLSGEQLQGKHSGGFDSERASWIAEQLRPVVESGKQVVIMVGGGNYARGTQLEDALIPRVVADNIGMLATVMNALALTSVFTTEGLSAVALSNIQADQVIDRFTHRRALSHLEKGRVVVIAGGIGRPYLTTDTAAVNLALEMDCDVVLKATKVDGVFDRDPAKYPEAKKIEHIAFADALVDSDVSVMDNAALALAMDHHKPVIVFALLEEGNIERAVSGEHAGTTIGEAKPTPAPDDAPKPANPPKTDKSRPLPTVKKKSGFLGATENTRSVYLLGKDENEDSRLADLQHAAESAKLDDTKVVYLSAKSTEGQSIIDFYDVHQLPAVLLLLPDGQVYQAWNYYLPSVDELTYSMGRAGVRLHGDQ